VGRAFASDDEVIVISIVDQGPGLLPADLERIFEPFFSTKGRSQGSGLGLAICHSLIEALQGALAITSRLGAGTTARVFIPAMAATSALEPASARERGERSP
jgi:signal transduction histidine kinase